MTDLHSEAPSGSRSTRLDRAIRALLAQAPELEAAAVVSFDGLPMAAALPPSMDEDRVAAMSAALLSLGERAAEGLGRGQLSQVYIEGDDGTVFLVSADDEAVLVAVAAKGAKAGMMLYEVRRTAGVVAAVLRAEEAEPAVVPPVEIPVQPVSAPATVSVPAAVDAWRIPVSAAQPTPPVASQVEPAPERLVAPYELQPAAPRPDASPYATRPHAAPGSEVPQYDVPQYEVPQYEVPQYQVPQYEVPQYDLPTYDLPLQEVPQYDLPLYDLPQQDLPGQEPAEAAQPTAAPYVAPATTYASYAPAPEPVWPSYGPTGSVMPGGGVPPSTWS